MLALCVLLIRDRRSALWALGAFAATALSSVLLAFAVTVGLGVASASPTWRDASAALAILSGLYLIIQAVLSFGLGGYIAGHTRIPAAAGARRRSPGAGMSVTGIRTRRTAGRSGPAGDGRGGGAGA